MCRTELAGLYARKKRSQIAENERPSAGVADPRTLHPMVGTKLCLSRERGGTLTVWSDMGGHLLKRYPVDGVGSRPATYPMARTRLTVVRAPDGQLYVLATEGSRLGKRYGLTEDRP